MTGHRFSPDMQMLFFSERAGQNSVEYAVVSHRRRRSSYTLARYRADDIYANPGSIVSARGGGGGGGGAAAAAADAAAAAAAAAPVLLSADGSERVLPGHGLRQEPAAGRPEDVHRQGRDQDRREGARSTRATTAASFERVSTVLDPDAEQFIVAREGPTDVPQQYPASTAARRDAADEERGLHAGPDARANVERFTVERPDGFKFRVKVTLPPDYQAGHAAAGAVLVLPARVRDAGGLRPAGSHVQQERVRELRHAVDGVLRRASATRSSSPTRRSSARRGR